MAVSFESARTFAPGPGATAADGNPTAKESGLALGLTKHYLLHWYRLNGGKGMAVNTVARVLGGSPVSVLARLVLMSVLAGVVLSTVGLDPWNIIASVEVLARQVYAMGFDAVFWAWRYFLLGAVVVVPLWLLMRLARRR
jgi:hypothetical protein